MNNLTKLGRRVHGLSAATALITGIGIAGNLDYQEAANTTEGVGLVGWALFAGSVMLFVYTDWLKTSK
jgi:hypothetical protein